MDGFTCRDLVLATGGTLLMGKEDTPIRHISLDSRKMEGDDLFVPIIGENVDAHKFLCQAIGNGAAAVFTSRHRQPEEVRAAILNSAGMTYPGWKQPCPLPGLGWRTPKGRFRISAYTAGAVRSFR